MLADHAAIDPEPGTPAHMAEMCRYVRTLIVDLLKFFEGWLGVFRRLAERIAGDEAPTTVSHWEEP